MTRSLVRAASFAAVSLAFAGAARAQTVLGDFAGGYSALSAPSGSMPLGWFVSAGRNFTDNIELVGQVTGNYQATSLSSTVSTSVSEYAFVGGPRLVLSSEHHIIYAQLLVGVATATATGTGVFGGGVNASASDTALCYVPGLGVELDFNRSTALRLETDYRLVTAGGSVNEFQFLVGVMHRFLR